MADNVSITQGAGTTIAADDVGGVLFQRVKNVFGADGVATDVSSANPLPVSVVGSVRELRAATASAPSAWTITTAGAASVIAADPLRVKVMLVHNGSARVFIRFDGTIPTSASHHWWLDPGDRYEVPTELTGLAVSMSGQSTGGTILSMLGSP